MRALRAVPLLLVAFVTVAILVLALPAIAPAYVPGTTYSWVQPGTVTAGIPDAWGQPPASIPTVGETSPTPTLTPLFGAGYHWVQLPAEIPGG